MQNYNIQSYTKICVLIIFVFLISSCSQKPASIEFKGYTFYGKDYYEYNDDDADKSNRKNLRASGNKTKNEELTEVKEEESADNNTETTAVKQTTTAATSVASSSSSCPTIVQGGKEAEVKKDDTLYGIAIKYDIPVKKLIELNNLKEPYTLKPGQKLVITQAPVSQHVVASGENLSMISNKYNVKTIEIAKLNNLNQPYLIKVGQKLKLPSGYECKEAAAKPVATAATTENTEIKKVVKAEPKAPITESVPLFKKNNFVWPVKGKIISKFGPKEGSLYNDGIDIAAAKSTPFRATEDGVVAYVGNELKGYGNLIIIKHANNWVSAYAHADEILVQRGASVKKGDIIGKVGQSGNVSESQLYFGLRKGRKALDPERYLN